jgi:2-dehydro-3-deoxygluconokinase
MYDLVSLGEVMLRMSPPRYERLRRATKLDVQVAGSQLNVAANLARLGWSTAFISKLPDNPLGLLARDACLSYGVSMEYVNMVPGARMGVNYLEFTVEPRAGVVVYDRAGSAASTVEPNDFDWVNILKGTKLAYTDGIFPGLSESCAQTAMTYLQLARQQGCLTAFDVNYRYHLWTESRAKVVLSRLLPLVDVLVTNRFVSENVFGFEGSDATVMQHYADNFGCKLICLTTREMVSPMRGAWSSQALYDGEIIVGRRLEFDVVDRFGTGDAYMAGVLYGFVTSAGNVQHALDFGNALCALAHTIEGDVAQVSVDEVEAVLSGGYNAQPRR